MGLPVACGTSCVHMWKHAFHSCVCTYACMGTYSGSLLDSPRATVLLQFHWPLGKDLAGCSHGCGCQSLARPM